MAMTLPDCEKLMRDSGICLGRTIARRVARASLIAYRERGAAAFATLPGDLIAAGVFDPPLGQQVREERAIIEAKATAAAIIIREHLEPR